MKKVMEKVLQDITLHQKDLPADVGFGDRVAIDTEAMGLSPHRDRLCLVQLSAGDGSAHLVQMSPDEDYDCPNLKNLLQDTKVQKIFHYARFDVAMLQHKLNIAIDNIFCTKIASRLVRNFTSRHGLKTLLSDLLDVEISKQQQSSDWGQDALAQEQQAYAATDVLYLHRLQDVLETLMAREKRSDEAYACFRFLPTLARLDLLGYTEFEYFRH